MTTETLNEIDIFSLAKSYGEYLRDEGGRQMDKKKIIYNLLNEISIINKIVLDAPLMVGIDLLAECNLKCEHCYRDEQYLPFGHGLSTEHILKTIDNLDELGALEVYLTGGEPFLRKDIPILLQRIKSYNMMTNIHTNGTVGSKSLYSELSKILINSMDFIQVSIDGMEDTHNAIRKANIFKVSCSNIKLMKSYNLPVRINMVVNNRNYTEMVQLYELAVDLNVNEIAFSPLLMTRFNSSLSLPTTEQLLVEFCKVINEHRKNTPSIRIVQDPIAVPCGNSYIADEMKRIFGKPRYVCPAGSIAIEIDPKGDVYPCPYLHYKELSAGNINTESLSDIWRKKNIWSSLRGAKSLSKSACSTCDFNSGCQGACAAQSYHLTGSLDGADVRCDSHKNSKN